uniref:hypothetical protein n=1 Tax=Escherichia coli TaxID=562 RepID=UPI0024DEE50A
ADVVYDTPVVIFSIWYIPRLPYSEAHNNKRATSSLLMALPRRYSIVPGSGCVSVISVTGDSG